MKHSPRIVTALLIVALTLAIVGMGALILAVTIPGAVACTLIKFVGLQSLPSGILVEPAIPAQEQASYLTLVSEARARIERTFGAPRAEPIVVFFEDPRVFGPLNINIIASTSYIPGRVCTLVGPKGQNIDIIAHELMHAELCERVGYWRRLAEIPVWFDEGVAMQLDLRPRFELPQAEALDTAYVRQLDSPCRFYPPNDQQLIHNYAAAKVEVAHWLDKVGAQTLYQRFECICNGERFSTVFAK
jgi:hypothetical protein